MSGVIKMKAAIYSRKSKFTEKGDSIENQLTLCEEYGRSIGVTEFIKYEDEGFSGGNTNRPQFQVMMKNSMCLYAIDWTEFQETFPTLPTP
jgi:DNA invertase Pin-like site-specific DNA recombinase